MAEMTTSNSRKTGDSFWLTTKFSGRGALPFGSIIRAMRRPLTRLPLWMISSGLEQLEISMPCSSSISRS